MQAEIIRVDGTRETLQIKNRPNAMNQIRHSLKAEALDCVNLRDGRVMLVDDEGIRKGRPVNMQATPLYHAICRQGTTHCIHGDVAIVRDSDFE